MGCCALIELGGGAGEPKRMIVDKRTRQQGVGRALLRTVETIALGNRINPMRMEVGALAALHFRQLAQQHRAGVPRKVAGPGLVLSIQPQPGAALSIRLIL